MTSERLEPSTSSAIALCSPQIPYVEFKKIVSLKIRHDIEITNLKQTVVSKDEEIELVKRNMQKGIDAAVKLIVFTKSAEISTLQNKIASLQKDIATDPFSDFRQKELATIRDELINSVEDQFPPPNTYGGSVSNAQESTIINIMAEALKYSTSLIEAELYIETKLRNKDWTRVQCEFGWQHSKPSTGYYLMYKVDSGWTLQVFWSRSYQH